MKDNKSLAVGLSQTVADAIYEGRAGNAALTAVLCRDPGKYLKLESRATCVLSGMAFPLKEIRAQALTSRLQLLKPSGI
jgi:hypothetical protein